MIRTRRHALLLLPLAALFAALFTGGVLAQQASTYDDAGDIRRALVSAQNEGNAARQRAEKLEGEAAQANQAADRTAREAAGVAARIQQAQAEIAVGQAKAALIEGQRRLLRARLAERQLPLVRLTASLQRMSRRPPVLSLLRPGSVRDTMHLRAILATMLPEVERRTASLRAELRRARELQQQAGLAVREMRASQELLQQRRQSLVSLETTQRLASRAVSGIADRESERALALAERSRDLDTLAAGLGKTGKLRDELAALPGPILRPARPAEAQVAAAASSAAPPTAGLPSYVLPVSGRLVSGFGETPPGMPRSRGIALAVRQGAQAIAPAPGRVVFAGPYRGYGSIVIVEHAGGWTSLVTGLAQLDTRVGETLVSGSPLGIAGAGRPVLTLELRRNGEPVNPLEYLRAL